MRRFRKCFALLLVVLGFCTSCATSDLSLVLPVCGSYAVPGMFCYEIKGDGCSCTIVEEDPYGRILFEYKTTSVVTGSRQTAYAVCQKYDSDYVYFYEDICYLILGADEPDLAHLKASNDWGSPLNESRMSRRKNLVSLDLFIVVDHGLDHSLVRSACARSMGIDSSQIHELCVLDVDPNGSVLYWFEFEQDGSTGKYFVLIDPRYAPTFLDATQGEIAPTDLASFKQVNGWVYGFSEHAE